MTACKYCRRKLRHIKSKAGKVMPVELEPIDPNILERGDTVMFSDGSVVSYDPEDEHHAAQEAYWIPHWESCSPPPSVRRQFRG